jgi:CHAT domain-containing protein/tetratricopeptide (TPR) repeat protein
MKILKILATLSLLQSTTAQTIAELETCISRVEESRKAGKIADARRAAADGWSVARKLPAKSMAERATRSLLTNLGVEAYRMRDLRLAHDVFEFAFAACTTHLKDDDNQLRNTLKNLEVIKRELHDYRGAIPLSRKMLEIKLKLHPSDHREVLGARHNLALSIRGVGDFRSAVVMLRGVVTSLERVLPDNHIDLQKARGDLAGTLSANGNLREALALEERVLATFLQTLPDDHRFVQIARGNLAETRAHLGDLRGALELQSRAFRVISKRLRRDDPTLLYAEAQLANTRVRLGDWRAALPVHERAYEVLSRSLPENARMLQFARSNLATTLFHSGEFARSATLLKKELEIAKRILPDHHRRVQSSRTNLAVARKALGDFGGALELEQKAHDVIVRALPTDHPDFCRVKVNLAETLRVLGRVERAETLAREAVASSRALPAGVTIRREACRDLATICALSGKVAEATSLAEQLGRETDRLLRSRFLSPRAAGDMAHNLRTTLNLMLSLASGLGDAKAQPQLARSAFRTSQFVHGVHIRVAQQIRRAMSADTRTAARLQSSLRSAAAEISRLVTASPPGTGKTREEALRVRKDKLAAAVARKEKIEEQLLALATKAGGAEVNEPTIKRLAARLSKKSAAVAIVGYRHRHRDRSVRDERIVALILGHQGKVRMVPLGSRKALDDHVAALRSRVLRTERLRELRRAVLDPILAATGDVKTLYISVDEALELVPLDALPTKSGKPVGSDVQMRSLVSLFDLLEKPAVEIGPRPRMLALGGIDYDARPGKPMPASTNDKAKAVSGSKTGEHRTFAPLRQTGPEIDNISAEYRRAFGKAPIELLSGRNADKDQLVARAANVSFLHLATHGYFASQSIRSSADEASNRLDLTQQVLELSPMTLAGVALSGANLPPDEMGETTGVMTAEEILGLNLTSCYLVTLSACDTAIGVRRAGQGYASLRAALSGAGARYTLNSLWRVNDKSTRELMVEFYRRLWQNKEAPHTALWNAKMTARKAERPFRQWAGWMLTGH